MVSYFKNKQNSISISKIMTQFEFSKSNCHALVHLLCLANKKLFHILKSQKSPSFLPFLLLQKKKKNNHTRGRQAGPSGPGPPTTPFAPSPPGLLPRPYEGGDREGKSNELHPPTMDPSPTCSPSPIPTPQRPKP